MVWPFRKKQSVDFEKSVIVHFDDEKISSTYPDGIVEVISWKDLELIEVHTSDTGPFGADVWFVLTSESSSCSFPVGATGYVEATDHLAQFPGFELKGMDSTENAKYICWARNNAL
jgi:hypothetical protein